MGNYEGLAAVYDYLVSGVDFEGWADYVEKIARHFGHNPSSVLDLACGTGNTVLPLASRGYEAIGVDISPQMIGLAKKKAGQIPVKVDFHVEDIRNFILDKPVDLVTCFHDGLNYLTDPSGLREVFIKTARNLKNGGLFIFDLNTIKWVEQFAGSPFIIEENNFTIIYDTAYEKETSIWTIDITCFIKEGEVYRKFKEQHLVKGYEQKFIEDMLVSTGFDVLAVYDAFTFEKPHVDSKRHFFVAAVNK